MSNLSEEEILTRVNHFIEFIEFNPNDTYRIHFAMVAYPDKEYFKAIKGLLDLYNKEKEKNKELENADLTTVYLDGCYDCEKKWKDKIREKIKELEEIRGENADEIKRNVRFYSIYDSYDLQIYELKELLEE